jgi:hypothetical protein
MILNHTVEQAAIRYAEALVKFHATRDLEKSEHAHDRQIAREAFDDLVFLAEDLSTAAKRQAELQESQIRKEIA